MYHAWVRRTAVKERIPPPCLCSEMYIPELSLIKPRHERRQRAQMRPGPAVRFNKRTFGCWQEAISESLLGGSHTLPPASLKKPWTLNPFHFKKYIPPPHLLESSDIDMNNFTSQPLQPPAQPHGMTVSTDVLSRRTRWKNRRQEITQFQILHTEKTAAALLLNPFFSGRYRYLVPARKGRRAETQDNSNDKSHVSSTMEVDWDILVGTIAFSWELEDLTRPKTKEMWFRSLCVSTKSQDFNPYTL